MSLLLPAAIADLYAAPPQAGPQPAVAAEPAPAPAAAQSPAALAQPADKHGEFLSLITGGKTVMWVGAHPDDEIITAPLLARAADQTKVIVVSFTKGNAGENKLGGPENCAELGEIRAKELAASCKVLGAEMRAFDFLDVRYSESNDAAAARWKQSGKDPETELVKVIREWKPDIIITFDPDRARGHTLHQASGSLATAAFRDAADPAKFPEQLSATVKTWQAQRLYYCGYRTSRPDDKRPDELIPAGDRSPKRGKTYAEIGLEARAQHPTQFASMPPPAPGRESRPAGFTSLFLASPAQQPDKRAEVSAQAAQAAPAPGKQPQAPLGEWLDPDHSAPNGTQYKTFSSKVLGRDVSYLLYLPPEYEQQQNKRYPVIYWLHGRGGNQRAGATVYIPHLDAAVKQGSLPPVIVVLVNGMGRGHYLDSQNGQLPIESVIVKDLVPHIDQTYRTIAKREARVIEGFSMGGFGAGHLGFKYPELFGTVIVNSGALADATWFPAEEHPKQLARKNADKMRGQTHIRIGCGSLDDLLPANQALHEVLGELKIENQFEVVPDVAHNSALYYQKLGTKGFEFLRKSLDALDKGGSADPKPAASEGFEVSYTPGERDAAGQFLGGTELRILTAYRGKLYAGNGYWEDQPGPEGKQPAQVLVLDGPAEKWRVDHPFDEKLADGRPRHLAISALEAVTFTTDGNGRKLAQPVSMLCAGTWDLSGFSQVFSRDDSSGRWTAMTLPGERLASGIQQVRALGFHADRETGADHIFAGNSPYGIYRGAYDPAAPGHIVWASKPELDLSTIAAPPSPGLTRPRVASFAECNGNLYATVGQQIYRRVDGAIPSWRLLYTNPKPGRSETGLRGLTAVPSPSGSGQVLLAAVEGSVARVVRIDPAEGNESTELDIQAHLSRAWNTRVGYIIAAYNNMTIARNPQGDVEVLFGIEAFLPADAPVPAGHTRVDGLDGGGWFFVRHADGRYDLHQIGTVHPVTGSPLVATRAIALSPFAADPDRIYFAGFDANKRPAHNTAWIFRAGKNNALGRDRAQLPDTAGIDFARPSIGHIEFFLSPFGPGTR